MIKIDRHIIIQVLGSLMNQPDYLNDTDKYRLELSDFPYTLDKYIFSAINNLYNEGDGANKIRTIDIINYLQENPTAAETLKKENGELFLQDCETQGNPENFNYYYNKLKKLNLIKEIQYSSGRNMEDIYCDNILNPNYNKINEKFEHMSISDILNKLKLEVGDYEKKYAFNTVIEESKACDDIEALIVDLKKKPEIGCQLQGKMFNTITRGGRKGKLYLRSAASGIGKTRSMVGDACNIAYPIRFDREQGEWVETGSCEKVLYIMTEQDPEEIKTMVLAYLTGYEEDMFLYGRYGNREMIRINQAIEIMNKYKDNLLFARIPDPSSAIIKNLFRRYNISYQVENFFYDYIFSSPAMLNEFRDLKIREDVALRLFTTTLKNLAIELNAFVMTSTQVSSNGESKSESGFKDYHNVQGSRAIVNLVDFACIMSRPTREELELFPECTQRFGHLPNLVTDVYKNRRGKHTMIRLWSYNDLGCCRKEDMFVTDIANNPITDFQMIDFSYTEPNRFKEVCNYYNSNLKTNFDTTIEKKVEISKIKPEDLIVDTTVFDNKKRFEKVDFKDLI